MKMFDFIKSNILYVVILIGLGMVLGFGLQKCNPLPSTNIITKDSTYYNITTIDSTYIEWDTTTKTITNPIPSSVVANTTKIKDGGSECDCNCASDSIRTYAGRIKVGDFGFVSYNLKAIGEITNMDFSNQIGVQNRMRIVKSDEYRSIEKTIDTTPFIRVYAGTEINPQQLLRPSVYADAILRKWQFGYRYEIGQLTPHNIKVGFKIFSL